MSAGAFLDACGFAATSTGTGSFVVSAAASGCQTPASAGAVNGTVYSYRAESADKSQWEEGFGAYTVSGTTLARTTITANSSGGATAINFTTIPNVYITALSQDLQNAALLTAGTLPAPRIAGVLRSYLAGLTLSTAGASTTFSVAAGVATDSTNVDVMSIASSISKTTGAWVVGSTNGGLDTGSIAASTWYHVFLIKRTDTGVVDVLFSLSASAPTMPTGYTLFRRIGSILTGGTGNWFLFSQNGDEFLWSVPFGDVAVATLGTTATLFTLTVPTSVQVRARIRGFISAASAATSVLVSSPDEAAAVVNAVLGNRSTSTPIAGSSIGTSVSADIRTNTSDQIRAVASAASTTLDIATYGWFDDRGKLS